MPDSSPEPTEMDWLRQTPEHKKEKHKSIIEDTEIYQIIFQEGFEIGFLESLSQARMDQETFLPIYRVNVLLVVQERFPELLGLAWARLDKLIDFDRVGWLYGNLKRAKDQEEAREILEDGGKSRLSTLREMK